jgi:D-alanyl-D-alanine carboxypeptidase
MTALLVLEHGDLDAVVTVQPEDLPTDVADSSTMGLQAGETISVTDLLWGLLLPSGNDAANVLARQVSGSVPAFVAAMNRRSQELGLKQTHFVNPHGLDADGHLSSAADLLTLTRKLWDYPLFRSIVATANSEKAGHQLVNTNELLTTYQGATGVKTGTTDNAGECLIASIERDGQTVFMVIMGSSDRFTDAKNLYETFRAAYAWKTENAQELSVINRVYDAAC